VEPDAELPMLINPAKCLWPTEAGSPALSMTAITSRAASAHEALTSNHGGAARAIGASALTHGD
jgi:hypothetical protein